MNYFKKILSFILSVIILGMIIGMVESIVKNNSNKINILENLYKAYYLASKRPIKKLRIKFL